MTINPTASMSEKQKWQEIDNCWKKFVVEGKEIHLNSVIRKEIAESWMRSKKMGIDPFSFKLEVLRPAEFKKILAEKSLLLKIARPFMEQLAMLIFLDQSAFGISLADENGLILHSSGDEEYTKHCKKYNIAGGAIFSEDAVGTHAGGTCTK